MTRSFVLRPSLLFSATLIAGLLFVAAPPSTAQESTRGLKLKVGLTNEEAARARNINLWAVVVGISRYQYGDQTLDGLRISNLKSAAEDAQAVYEFLRSPEGGEFRDVAEGGRLVMLKDEEATRERVLQALNGLKASKPEDYFIIYIAAHGTLILEPEPGTTRTVETPYFVLHDTDLRAATKTGLKMDAFRDIIGRIPAKRGLVISDTCHSGGIQLAGRDTSNLIGLANRAFIAEMNKVSSGIGFISAADTLGLSYESDEFNQGVFTYCLLQGLRGDADKNLDGKVTFDELVSFLRTEVPRLTDNKQYPQHNVSEIAANRLTLSIPYYTDPNPRGAEADFGQLIIRTPDIDGVQVAINGEPFATLDSRTERTARIKKGEHTLTFARGDMKRELIAVVEPGKPKFVEVNLTFSEADDDTLVSTSNQFLNVYFREDREPGAQALSVFQKGVESFNRQRFKESIDLFNRAIQANNNAYADAFVYRGRAEQSLGMKADAVRSFSAAVTLRPTDFETRTLLAEAKFNAGHDVNEVLSEIRSVLRRHPNFSYAHVVYGDALLLRRDLSGAERSLRKAIRINPKYAPARLILADVLTHSETIDKKKEAVNEAQEALNLFDEISRKQVSAARGLKRLSISHIIFGGGRYENAAVMAEANHMLGKVLTRAVGYDYTNTISDPDGWLNRARGHLDKATELAAKLPSNERLALVYETSSLNHFLRGDMSRAVKDGEMALKTAEAVPHLRGFPDAHFTLSQVFESDQKYARAVEHLSKAIQGMGAQMSPTERFEAEERLKRLERLKVANRQKD